MKRLFSLKKDIGYLGRKDTSPSKENGLNESQSMESSQDMLRHSRQLQSSRVYMDLRKKLLPDTNEFGDGLRQRHTEANTEDEMVNRQTGAPVKGRTDMNCENIADHMLSLTQSLREQTEIANRIIRSDTEVVSESNDAVDDNLYALNQESRKLLTHSSFDRNCWVWVMITVVLITFIGKTLNSQFFLTHSLSLFVLIFLAMVFFFQLL